MRIKIEGKRSPAEIGQLVTEVLIKLGQDFPELHFGRYNLYFTPLNAAGDEVLACNEQGKIIETIVIPDPNKPPKVQKKKTAGAVIQMPDPNMKIKTRA